jgi:response regulator RpfG family c-di-GMP phosphodiesterase
MNDLAAMQANVLQRRLLCVDDEANILNALRRLFRSQGYDVQTAGSGAQALELLEKSAVDLVISDMRMPEMDGAQFLEQVRRRWPDTMRILLTGHSDMNSTIAAINQGGIYRYVSKPWNDSDMLMVARQALELRTLLSEKARLEELTRRQNLELQTLNAGLEDVVAQRTASLQQTMSSLEEAHRQLKKGFITSITVFANLIELRQRTVAGYSRRISELARQLARKLNVGAAEMQDITIAAMLRDIGKLGLPDRIVNKAFKALSNEERAEVMMHPVKGQAALMALEQLADAALLIRSQHECCDGSGFPDHLRGAEIPRGAAILAVANDYYALQHGQLEATCYSAPKAHAFIVDGRGKRYDPEVVDAFVAVMESVTGNAPPPCEEKIPLDRLASGMVLASDLTTREGVLLLCAERVLDAGLIQKIRSYAVAGGHLGEINVRATKRR